MTISVVTVVTLLVFVMLGYRFNRDTSTIQQGGLVQFNSKPEGASVTIGKANLSDTTPSKITVNPGDYDVKMQRAGYLPWGKNVTIEAGEVLWLNYTQLVPTNIETENIATFNSVAQAETSPNGKFYAVFSQRARPTVTFVELSDSTPKKTTLTIPAALLPEGTVSYYIESWSDDSERLLVSARTKTAVEWLLIKRDDAGETINVSDEYSSSISKLTFDARSSRRLVMVTNTKELRLIDTGAESLSPVVATNVSYVTRYGSDGLFYVHQAAKNEQRVSYRSFGSDKSRELKRFEGKSTVLVAAATYFGDPHIAISTGSQLDIYKLDSLPSSQSEDAISMASIMSQLLPSQPRFLSLLSSGRFVVAQYATGVAVYDVELAKYTLTAIKRGLSGELRWLDRYHFYVSDQKSLSVMEFDGANQHVITDLSTNFDAVQSDNGKYIYSLTKDDKSYTLQRSKMILD